MTKRKVQVLRRHDFPNNVFFKHLQKGTAFYQNRNFGRAIEEWVAASRIHYEEPIDLKKVDGRIFSGSVIEEVPFIFFLYAIHINKITGLSLIKNEHVTKKLLFKKGTLIATASTKKEERIGRSILKRGNISPQKMEKLLTEAKSKGKKIGRYLIEKKLISENVLNELLSLQIDEMLSDIFFWPKGEFYVVETPLKEEEIVRYAPLKIACMAARRGFNFADFRKEIPNNKAVFRPSPYAEEEKKEIMKKLNANYHFIFSLIDGARNIEQLIRFSGADEVSVVDILYRLNGMGLIRKTKEVVEYEDKEFIEVSKILEVLFEVFTLITTELQNEIGVRGKEIIETSLKELKPDHQKIFIDVSLDDPERLDKNAILRNIAFHFPSPDQRPIFIDAFLGLFLKILDELKRFLGMGLTKDTSQRISRIISNIEIFSMNTTMKKRLLEILNVIANKYA